MIKSHRKSHGLSGTKEYQAWADMIQRCYNGEKSNFRWYGERGIRVCNRWLYSFEKFLADMGPCPENYTLHRIDNDRHYRPDNCKWASWEEQATNRRKPKRLSCLETLPAILPTAGN